MDFNFLLKMCMDVAQKQIIQGIQGPNRAADPNSNPGGLSRGKEAMNVPEGDHEVGQGRHRALMIGCNYRGSKAELRGCINDVNNLKELLTTTFGWSPSDITTMTDDDIGSLHPDKANVLEQARALVRGASPGDHFFFSYSGHGGQQEDPNGFEEDGMNETLLPIDFQRSGMITDDELNKIMIEPLPSGCKLTVFFDACHSGTGMDLSYALTPEGWKEAANPLHVQADVVMISGCMDEQTSADAMINGSATGALTHSLLQVLGDNQEPQYSELLQQTHSVLDEGKYKQRPVMTSSQAFNLDRAFSLNTIMPNKNQKLGRQERKKFEPNPNPDIMAFMQQVDVANLQQVCKIGMGLLQKYMQK
eukprot:GEMP01037201.1.p1 GENE.GEMP01037201.1~~GEMP01037201.1.p1  ORF type:complete len:362 (+),score=69.00 GEMP01037201.1:75-1160(+)